MFFNPVDSRWLYNLVDYTSHAMQPWADMALALGNRFTDFSESMHLPTSFPFAEKSQKISEYGQQALRFTAASFHAFHTLTDMYDKPEFGIDEIHVDDHLIEISEEKVKRKVFCNLLHFRKVGVDQGPIMLVIAPMSGHYATLLRDTVRDLLPYYDVYLTDWKNARDVPLSKGSFDFDEFVNYLVDFMHFLGSDVHVMAVCQPTVPALVATSLMASENDPLAPLSVTLIGGPVDTTHMPTSVNHLADTRRLDWFQQHVVSMVPHRYPGAMRLVYPGFMQLSGFLTMNLERHQRAIWQAIKHYQEGNKENADKTLQFYREYLSVMDITAEFYMQTMRVVFQEKLLPKGKLTCRGRPVRPQDITQTAVLAIEGERDDITGVGQTKAVLNLCTNLSASKKAYHLQEGVGHYGLFNGNKFREEILPVIRDFTRTHSQKTVAASVAGKKIKK